MTEILDEGPFYHGTKADLQVGDVLRAGFSSNYDEKNHHESCLFHSLG